MDEGTQFPVSNTGADEDLNQAPQLEPLNGGGVFNSDMNELKRSIVQLPQEATDSDLIEKEWVDALKGLVAHTSEDPFTQQHEISKVKTEYMLKRYNKKIGQGN